MRSLGGVTVNAEGLHSALLQRKFRASTGTSTQYWRLTGLPAPQKASPKTVLFETESDASLLERDTFLEPDTVGKEGDRYPGAEAGKVWAGRDIARAARKIVLREKHTIMSARSPGSAGSAPPLRGTCRKQKHECARKILLGEKPTISSARSPGSAGSAPPLRGTCRKQKHGCARKTAKGRKQCIRQSKCSAAEAMMRRMRQHVPVGVGVDEWREYASAMRTLLREAATERDAAIAKAERAEKSHSHIVAELELLIGEAERSAAAQAVEAAAERNAAKAVMVDMQAEHDAAKVGMLDLQAERDAAKVVMLDVQAESAKVQVDVVRAQAESARAQAETHVLKAALQKAAAQFKTLYQGVQMGQAKGVFNLEEASTLWAAAKAFTEMYEQPNQNKS